MYLKVRFLVLVSGAEHPLRVLSGSGRTGGPPAGGAWGAD